jgi:serine protease AprX
VHIVSDRASTGTTLNVLDANHDLNLTSTCAISTERAPFYTCASGTSMAAPHIVGVIALMEEASGGTLTPDQALEVLQRTARPLPGFFRFEVGAG